MLFLKIFNRIEIFIWRGGRLFFGEFQKFNERKFCLCVCYGGPVSFSQTHKFFAYSAVNRFHHVQQVNNKRAKRQIRILSIPSKLLSETNFFFCRDLRKIYYFDEFRVQAITAKKHRSIELRIRSSP
jgi:hypothetical protein